MLKRDKSGDYICKKDTLYVCPDGENHGTCCGCPLGDAIDSRRSKDNLEEKMSQEEKYKLALFAVIRNSAVMPQGVELGKTMHEINTMAVAVMAKIMESCDYENLKESYESVSN